MGLLIRVVTIAGHYDVTYAGGSVTTVGPTGQAWNDAYHPDGLSIGRKRDSRL